MATNVGPWFALCIAASWSGGMSAMAWETKRSKTSNNRECRIVDSDRRDRQLVNLSGVVSQAGELPKRKICTMNVLGIRRGGYFRISYIYARNARNSGSVLLLQVQQPSCQSPSDRLGLAEESAWRATHKRWMALGGKDAQTLRQPSL